jgi:hypothetical protein
VDLVVIEIIVLGIQDFPGAGDFLSLIIAVVTHIGTLEVLAVLQAQMVQGEMDIKDIKEVGEQLIMEARHMDQLVLMDAQAVPAVPRAAALSVLLDPIWHLVDREDSQRQVKITGAWAAVPLIEYLHRRETAPRMVEGEPHQLIFMD